MWWTLVCSSILFLSSDLVKTHVWHATYVLHVTPILCATHEPYFVWCMLVWSMRVRLCLLHTSKASCAACESVFSCACELTAILYQIRTKAYNEMAFNQNMVKWVHMQNIAFCQVYKYPYSNPLWMTLYHTMRPVTWIMAQDSDSTTTNNFSCLVT